VVDTVREAVGFAHATTLGLLFMVVVTSHVTEEVQRPAQELLAKGVDDGGNWGLLGQLMDFVYEFAEAGSVILAGLWYEDHVPLHVAGSLVVLAVGDLPREVWDQQGRVTDPTSGIIENLGRRERLVSTLVCKHP